MVVFAPAHAAVDHGARLRGAPVADHHPLARHTRPTCMGAVREARPSRVLLLQDSGMLGPCQTYFLQRSIEGNAANFRHPTRTVAFLAAQYRIRTLEDTWTRVSLLAPLNPETMKMLENVTACDIVRD